jgi:signal recognition particle subunit SEC65
MTDKNSNAYIEPTYKVNYVKNGIIDSIYVFKKDKDKDINTFFTQEELEKIRTNNTKVIYLNETIHLDDTIGMIKIKILNQIKQKVGLEEIYLYCQKLETFNAVSVYQALTQNKHINLTNVRLNQFISNIVSDANGTKFETSLQLKDVYDYDDILELKIDNKKLIVNKVLGQKFFIVENEYPFVVNPYEVKAYDSLLERHSRKSLTTLNSHLLLNSGEIVNNNIYFCLAEDVLQFNEINNIPQNITIKIYFPFLYEKNINNLDDLKEKKRDLIENTKKYVNDKTLDYFKTINMFYDIYNLRKNELNYVSKGIKYIKAIIKPTYKINIPLETIFKILHANQNNPLIKYNPSSRQENIYRLFTDKIATDGRKIPYLKKATIFKLIKNIGKTKSVSVYINNTLNENIEQLICDFDENGFTTVTCELETVIDEKEIDNLFIQNINPIVQEISNLLEQSGYKMSLFENIYNPNIEIKQLTYECNIKIKQAIKLDAYRGCVSSVFINESTSFKQDIHLRFKRVSNFNKVTSQEAFILEKSSEGLRGSEIIEALLENFHDDLNRKEAEELVIKVANEIEVERGVKNIEIKARDNPGFKTVIHLDKNTGVITIRVENINDIFYLSTIPIYLDSIIRITQDKKSTAYSTKKINDICSSGEKEEVVMNDIISPVESQLSELEIPSIDDGENVKYSKFSESSNSYDNDSNKEQTKNAFDLFFDDDEDEEDENHESSNEKNKDSDENLVNKGGQPNNFEKVVENKGNNFEKVVENKGNNFEKVVENKGRGKDDEEYEEKEEDNDDEDDDDEEEHEEGRDNVINIDNLQLKKKEPYFQTRIEKLDPALIIKEDTKEFNSYVRTCSSTMKRHPVILTDKELEDINKEHPGFLRDEDVIKYGSNPKKQYNYICPRYWCLKNNTIVDPNELTEVLVNGKTELKSKNCGYVLPEDAKVVKPGYYVYEFYKPKSGNKNYKRFPGFQEDKHPQGFCLPCCFEKYNTVGRINAKKKCLQNVNEENIKEITKEDVSNKVKQKEDEYIIGPDKFPLPQSRWGYLPVQIQQILREINADCQISKTNTNIKSDHPCLLRHGVEINDKQSFVACISDVIFYGTKASKVLSIKEMKQHIIQALTIDNFITYQNGNLVNDFKNTNVNNDIDEASVLLIDHKSSKLYSKINQSNEQERIYYKNVVSAFQNFVNYLKDDDTVIDHTYLWDIISKPNKSLFPSGINIIILKIPNDDITNNVELLCPSNHYSNEFYEARKPTIILIKEDNYYEPVYLYTSTSKKIQVVKEFKEYDPHLSKTLRIVFRELIKPAYNNFCKPLNSMPNVYKTKRPLLLLNLIEKLDKYNYKIVKLVMNFNNKIIGVIAETPSVTKLTGFVPCYPSSFNENLNNEVDFVFMNDLSLWKNYEETYDFLMKLAKKSKNKTTNDFEISCNPILKVVEDEMVVGILTATNQFVQISQPIPEMDIKKEHDLPSLKNTDYLVKDNETKGKYLSSDAVITTSNKVDTERVDYIKKITYETKFYNIFRNTIKLLLNDYKNSKVREKVEQELSKDYIIYTQKLNKITELLKELTNEKIQFIGNENYYKLIDEFTTCIVKDKESCEKSPNLCMYTENNSCNLILPKKNLLTLKDNKEKYFGKMADELIRYSRIRTFIMQPQSVLTFDSIGYNLRDNEIIMLQSLLTQDYFETLEPAIINKYVKYNSYDETEPVISQTYDNQFETFSSKVNKEILEKKCTKKINNKISSALWNHCFPSNFKEVEYDKSHICTFECIITIIEKKTNEKVEINNIKNILYDEYKKYLLDYSEKIIEILTVEGKKNLCDQIKAGLLSFENLIYSDNYFLTTFDLWLLVDKYKIPTIFISSKNLLQTNFEKNLFLGYGNINDNFCFIVIPGFRSENIPSYKIIQSNENDIFISIEQIKNSECVTKINNTILEKFSIEEYLKKIQKNTITNKSKQKIKQKIIIEEDNAEELPEQILTKENTKTTTAKGGARKKSNNKTRKLYL